MVVGAKQAGLNISITADLLRYSCTAVLQFTQNDAMKKKHPVSCSSVSENFMLIREVNREWSDWFKPI